MDPWFDPQTAGMIGGIVGTSIGMCGALIGCMSGYCVKKGKRTLLLSMIKVVIAIPAVLALVGITALCVKQPYHVWYPFLLAGGIGVGVFGGLFPSIRSRFTQQELNQIKANDL